VSAVSIQVRWGCSKCGFVFQRWVLREELDKIPSLLCEGPKSEYHDTTYLEISEVVEQYRSLR
jgi:hypothetical protein